MHSTFCCRLLTSLHGTVPTIPMVSKPSLCAIMQVVDESDTLVNFALALKKASLQNGVSGLGLPVATKKPRGAAAANGKGKLR